MQSRCISNIPRLAVTLAVSLMLAFMPFSVNFAKYRVTLERNEAHAIAPVFAGAAAFLTEMATAAGFATTGEFVATIAGMTAVGTGMTIATEAGVRYGTEASQNLNNLVDAADYPDWDTLSSTEQSSWGSKDNYDSAKFNSLMAAYGLGDAYGRYQSAWGSGGAGNFSFSSTEQSSLEQIGEIGSNWANGVGNTVGSIKNLLNSNSSTIVSGWMPLDVVRYSYDAENAPVTLPSYVPSNGYAVISNYYELNYENTNGSTGTKSGTISTPVYMYAYKSDNWLYFEFLSRDNQFTGTGISNAVQITSNYGNYYYQEKALSITGYSNYTVNVPILFNATGYMNTAQWQYLNNLILNGNLNTAPVIQDYPSLDIDNGELNNVEIYFPPSGITDETTWDELLTYQQEITDDLSGVISLLQHIDSDLHNMNIPGEPDLQPIINYLQHIDTDMHKFGFVNGDVLKVHDGAVYTELENIYNVLVAIAQKMKNWGDISDAPDLIGDFDFDELENKVPDLLDTISDLAPFGSILLLSEMYSIMANYTQIESPELVFPFDFGGFDDQNNELIIDLSWLDDIKPLINFLCIAMLVIAIANATIRIVEIEAAS